MATKQKAQRRSSDQIRALVVEAAEHLFTEHGYAQTTMRAIAAEAEISLSVLHRHFPRKEQLFSAVFVGPFLASFEEFGAAWHARPDDEGATIGAFIRDLHRNLAGHRHTLVTLLAVGENPDAELVEEVRAELGEAWSSLQIIPPQIADQVASDNPNAARDLNMLIVALVTGLVLFNPWVAAARDGEDDQGLVDLAAALAAELLEREASTA